MSSSSYTTSTRQDATSERQSRQILDSMALDSHFSPYSAPDSPSPDDDENASLRSQALNADGTPKRPMNAFMIFARRRRPQVSAANQMMRTGEISKILSKEWNTMPMSDKQFYLDQAKKLKENFNAKYPDYVYRRRPNNSRKKRRTDASLRGVDAYGDPRDDSLSPHEHSPEYHGGASASPIDPLVPNEHSVSLASHQYHMGATSNPYSTHTSSRHYASDSGYPYYGGHSSSHHSQHRLPSHHASQWPSHDTSPSSAGSNLSPLLAGNSHGAAGGLHSSLSSYTSSAHSPSIYHPEDDAASAGSLWGSHFSSRLEPPVKLEPSSSWSHQQHHHHHGGSSSSSLSLRRGSLQPPSLLSRGSDGYHGHSHHHHGGGGGGSSSHARHWSSESSTGATGGGAGTTATATATGTTSTSPPSSAGSASFPPFQTLTAPFYPSSGSSSSSSGTVSPSTASSSSAASHSSSYFGSSLGVAQAQTLHERAQQQQQQQQHYDTRNHSPQFAHGSVGGGGGGSGGGQQPRAYSGASLGSTLGLSPTNAAATTTSSSSTHRGSHLWSSVRSSTSVTPTSSTAVVAKSEL